MSLVVELVATSATGRERWVLHSGPKSSAYIYCVGADQPPLLFAGHVGANVPQEWSEWNVLPSMRLTHEGEAADREWARLRGAP